MNSWDAFRRIASDRKSGAADIAARTAAALAGLEQRKDVLKAARRLLRVHGAMAPVWRAFALALEDGDLASFGEDLLAETARVAGVAAGWALPRRAVVLTHSASSAVLETLRAGRDHVRRVICTASLPGAEGRPFAQRLRRDGFDASVVADAALGRAMKEASVALVGADALTPEVVVNKVGTRLVALAAADHDVPCYALAGRSKLLPRVLGTTGPAYEETPLRLFAAIVTDRGPMSPAAIRRAAARIHIPRALTSLVP